MNSLFRIPTWYLKLSKFANARASQELIAAKMNLVNQTGQILQGTNSSFPDYLKGVAKPVYLQQGIVELTDLEARPHRVHYLLNSQFLGHPSLLLNVQPCQPSQSVAKIQWPVGQIPARDILGFVQARISSKMITLIRKIYGDEISCSTTFNLLMIVARPSNDFEPEPEIHPSAARKSPESEYVLNN